MLQKILSLCLFLVVCKFSFCQWSVIWSDTPNVNLRDIQFLDPLNGFVIGDDVDHSTTFLLKTTDGGDTWEKKPIPSSFIQKVQFMNDSAGYTIRGGVPVTLFETSDGGSSWSQHWLDSSFTVVGLAFPKPGKGYYFNNAGRFRRINSGGTSFSYLADTLQDGTNLMFTDSVHGFSPQAYYLYNTTNGGSSWFARSTGLPDYIYGPTFCFTDAQHGYMATKGISTGDVWRTTDGGATWIHSSSFQASALHANGDLVLALNDSGMVAISQDAGVSWVYEPLGPAYMYPSEYVPEVTDDGELFFTAGAEGVILKRTTPLLTEELQSEPIGVYPNPAEGRIWIKGWRPGDRFTVWNMLGVCEMEVEGCGEIDISGMAAGMYLLMSGGKTTRFVKE